MEPVDSRSSPDAKIALFRSLFRGRDDAYPRRFESRRTGKSGYAPACGNEWVPGICEKPRIKCADCPHHRLHESKREVRVYDYADLDVPMLARMFDRRCRGYEAVGYTIVLPAGAVSGWPADVPLPVDPAWKRDYAATVGRLVRDGVESSLATLFVDVARPFPPDAEGVDRARSATEAFLYRRLQTLAATAGRFRLNARLPIPFDGSSGLEIDLLCDKPRVAIELADPQHLNDPGAYRRDRRKDQLLQENGFIVLRFLADHVAKDLDAMLDAILRVLANRARVIH